MKLLKGLYYAYCSLFANTVFVVFSFNLVGSVTQGKQWIYYRTSHSTDIVHWPKEAQFFCNVLTRVENATRAHSLIMTSSFPPYISCHLTSAFPGSMKSTAGLDSHFHQTIAWKWKWYSCSGWSPWDWSYLNFLLQRIYSAYWQHSLTFFLLY